MEEKKNNPDNGQEQVEDNVSSHEDVADVSQLEEKANLADEYLTRLQRLQADFDNFRRRAQKEREELTDVITETVICKFLPVIDNLERAIVTAKSAANADLQMVAGIEMIMRQFEEVLAKLQVLPIICVGEKFDPQKHEAIMQIPDQDTDDDTIVEELQKGYQLRARTIRPSMVKVVKN